MIGQERVQVEGRVWFIQTQAMVTEVENSPEEWLDPCQEKKGKWIQEKHRQKREKKSHTISELKIFWYLQHHFALKKQMNSESAVCDQTLILFWIFL